MSYYPIWNKEEAKLQRKLRAEQGRMIEDHQRQLEHIQKTSEANIERTRKRLEAEKTELQRTADANAEKTRKRMETEIADLQSNVSRLEANLTKVRILGLMNDM